MITEISHCFTSNYHINVRLHGKKVIATLLAYSNPFLFYVACNQVTNHVSMFLSMCLPNLFTPSTHRSSPLCSCIKKSQSKHLCQIFLACVQKRYYCVAFIVRLIVSSYWLRTHNVQLTCLNLSSITRNCFSLKDLQICELFCIVF